MITLARIAILIALMLFGTIIGANATADGCGIVTKTPDGYLNLRDAPMMGAKIIARLKPGDELQITDETCKRKGTLEICNSNWVRVEGIWNGKKWSTKLGWAYSEYIRGTECVRGCYLDGDPSRPKGAPTCE
jgi:Bacterial SH3 domain